MWQEGVGLSGNSEFMGTEVGSAMNPPLSRFCFLQFGESGKEVHRGRGHTPPQRWESVIVRENGWGGSVLKLCCLRPAEW